jgi:YfiH family protein
MLITPEWAAPANVRAVMTTRRGGVSAPPWDSLNVGVHVGDSEACVLQNRGRIREAAGLPSEPVWLEQVHGTSVVALDEMHSSAAVAGDRPRADAAVTFRAGVVCAIQVADCMPVLFAARDGSVVGAAHAGWRGLAGGVLEAAVQAMGKPAGDVVAWLGPAIGPEYFEVGEDVVDAFTRAAAPADLEATQAAFRPKSAGKWLADLYALARLRLAALGITQVTGGGRCTVSEKDTFFSYRRDGQTGRMAALIWLKPRAA